MAPVTAETTQETCDACGDPATEAAVDVMRSIGEHGRYECKPVGKIKYGCWAHPPTSETHSTAEALLR